MRALISHEIAERFSSVTGIETIPLYPYNKLDLPVQCHADMLFCVLDNVIFCYGDYVTEHDLLDILKESGKKVVFVSSECSSSYPHDISLNVLIMGKTLFANTAYTAKEILDYASARGYKIVDVRQGYAACSTLVVNSETAVTADVGMYNAIKSIGKECYLVKQNDVLLNGYNCGFYGGASGILNGEVCFFGDVSNMLCGEEILAFLAKKNVSILPILSGRVYDFGGFKLI